MSNFRELLWEIHDKLNEITTDLNEIAINSENEEDIKILLKISLDLEKIIHNNFF